MSIKQIEIPFRFQFQDVFAASNMVNNYENTDNSRSSTNKFRYVIYPYFIHFDGLDLDNWVNSHDFHPNFLNKLPYRRY